MSAGVPASNAERTAAGRAHRAAVRRRDLAALTTTGRDALGILARQNADRVPELVTLRAERMGASPFAFYRGTAALMAADLAAGPSSGILVASCGDAHVANFGFYASPQRRLVFDLNDFDEAAWAPWEWDVKRLVASVVIAGQATGRPDDVIADAARSTVRQYARSLRGGRRKTPVERYYEHFDAEGGLRVGSRSARRVLRDAIAQSERRTGERATRKLTVLDADGRRRFVVQPPTMTHLEPDLERRVEDALLDYVATTRHDIRVLLSQYAPSDTVRRVVGVGSVGTRCYVTALVDGDGHVLLMQTKEAGPSVLVEHGGCVQPDGLRAVISDGGDGARVVAMQRVLQGASDPFLGNFRGEERDYYVRQFRDMKGGIDVETLDDESFVTYARTCAAVLARAHGQSETAAEVVGYLGDGRVAADALLAWSLAYAELSRSDYDAFLAHTADTAAP